MRAVVLQSNYLPWKGYFDLIQEADVFVYYDEVQYTKNDWRNRNRICSKNGCHWLTIPVGREAVKQKISDVRLPDPRWQAEHRKTLAHTYRPAKHFAQIEPLLADFYESREWRRLGELNYHCTETIARLLGLQTRFRHAKEFDLEGDRVERLVSLLRQLGATEYLSGPSAREYLAGQEHLFAQAGIDLRFKSYGGYPEYPQLSEPFEHGVSVIDLLANVPLADCRRMMTAVPEKS
ncbi:MAG: hypothetical protein JWM88_2651 [Verrucomicrobia bacterium]|nr:hypothetical protein [Verrucomicrobiota bacterium]